jgi:long-chain acyl-CoA synthetase
MLRECSTPPKAVVPDDVNASDDVFDNASRRPEHIALLRKASGRWHPVTAKQFADEVTALAAGLIASGIRPGERIALMSATRYEWALCDLAILAAGAVTVPIYETSSAEQVAWILHDSDAVAVFVEDAALGRVLDAAGVSAVHHRWTIEHAGLEPLVSAGRSVPAEQVHQRRHHAGADSLASIVYTSGTTGRARGCMISHRNLVAEVRNVAGADGVSESVLTDRATILLFLPLAHILARVVQFAAIHNGARIAHTSAIRQLATELRDVRPTVLLAVPRVFEKLYNTAQHTAVAAGHSRLFRAADATATAYSQALDAGRPGWWLRTRRRILDRLVYARLRAAMGGNVNYAVSGGAPLGARLGHFLRGAGVTILEGYGLTETCAGVTLNLPASQRIGTVGRPLPGCSVRIAADGEVLVKGTNVFDGYWRNEPATGDAFDEQGWLHTGDLGELEDGYLSITGRKKDLIVTASGKNVAPSVLEDRLRAHPLVDQCVLIGDGRPYIAVLLTLDPDALAQWSAEHHRAGHATIAELRDDRELAAAVQAAVDEANRAVSNAESIKRFRIVPGPFAVGDELTPTQKVRRQHVLAKLNDDVEALYSDSPQT